MILYDRLRWSKDSHFVTRADEVHDAAGHVLSAVLGSHRRCGNRVAAKEGLVELGFSQVGVDEADCDALGCKLCSGDRRELVAEISTW